MFFAFASMPTRSKDGREGQWAAAIAVNLRFWMPARRLH